MRNRLTKLKDTSAEFAWTAELDKPALDASRMTCDVIISTPEQDREGDVLIAEGIDLTQHRVIPAVMFEHGQEDIHVPIGLAESPEREYTVRTQAGMVLGKTYFARTHDGEQTFRLVEDGLLRGVSIGIRPIQQNFLRPTPEHPDGVRIDRSEMLEYSHCTLPMNPNCRVLAADALGRPYLKSAAIRRSLERHVPAIKSATVVVPEGVPVSTPAVAAPTATETTPVTTKSATDTPGQSVYAPLNDKGQAMTETNSAALVTPEDGDKDMLPGAKALSCYHACLMSAAQELKKAGTSQENPAVRDLMDAHAEHLDGHMSEVEQHYADQYPDYEPLVKDLKGEDYEETTDGMEEKPAGTEGGYEEDEEEKVSMKRAKRWAARSAPNTRLAKRLDILKRQRVEAKAKPVSKSAAVICQKAADHLKEVAALAGQPVSPTHAAASAHYEASLRTIAANPDTGSDDVLKSIQSRIETLSATNKVLERKLARYSLGR